MHRIKVRIVEEALDANNTIAAANRADFDRASVAVVNLMSAPGAGKTSLVDAVTGFVKAAEGSITLDGREITRWSPVRRYRSGASRRGTRR